jgi:hypothetical protein
VGGGGEEGLEHGAEASMWINSKWDQDHVFLVEFSNDVVAVNERGGGGGRLVYSSKFESFMTLKIIVCIGSDGCEDVFSDDGLGGRCCAGDVYVCSDGGIRANVRGGWIW